MGFEPMFLMSGCPLLRRDNLPSLSVLNQRWEFRFLSDSDPLDTPRLNDLQIEKEEGNQDLTLVPLNLYSVHSQPITSSLEPVEQTIGHS